MIVAMILLEEPTDLESINLVLSDSEDDGILDFPFSMRTVEDLSLEEAKSLFYANPTKENT
jgi:hypothetical protein